MKFSNLFITIISVTVIIILGLVLLLMGWRSTWWREILCALRDRIFIYTSSPSPSPTSSLFLSSLEYLFCPKTNEQEHLERVGGFLPIIMVFESSVLIFAFLRKIFVTVIKTAFKVRSLRILSVIENWKWWI